jgi:hypothetical protein
LADKNNNGIPDVLEGATTDATGCGVRTVVKQVVTQTGKLSPGQDLAQLPTSASRILQASWSSDGSSGGVTMTWPTLLALLATFAAIAGAAVWWLKS